MVSAAALAPCLPRPELGDQGRNSVHGATCLLHCLLPIKPQLPNLKSHLYPELSRALGNTTKKWKRLKQVQIWAVAGDLPDTGGEFGTVEPGDDNLRPFEAQPAWVQREGRALLVAVRLQQAQAVHVFTQEPAEKSLSSL